MPSHRYDVRQLNHTVSAVASGTMTSCPADMPPPASPSARPRRPSNHRAITDEPAEIATPPAPSAISSPEVT